MVKVSFSINYQTNFGESIVVVVGGKEVALSFTAGNWSSSIEASEDLSYKYAVKYDTGSMLNEEFGTPRKVKVGSCDLFLVDNWRAKTDESNTLFTSFFLEGSLQPVRSAQKQYTEVVSSGSVLRFNLRCAQIETGDQVAVYGNLPCLGNWDKDKAFVLCNADHPQWAGEIAVEEGKEVEYKYVILNSKGEFTHVETGDNRKAIAPKKGLITVMSDESYRFEKQWRGAGVALPVFSLRTANSGGVGEFTDIPRLVDWAKAVGLKLVQILPINDTVAKHKWTDSYPYAAISVYALHPIYLNMATMGKLKSETTQDIIDTKAKQLNELEQIDYEAVMVLKSRFYKLLYDEQKKEFHANKEFQEWYKNNEEWLLPYACFSYFRDLYQTPDFSQWGEHQTHTMDDLRSLYNTTSSCFDDIAVHFFIQWHLHLQLASATAYCRKNKVCLKGDIPIGIFRYSVDGWMTPQLFNMEMQSGAPPDDFAVDGQNWGFPTYNWEEMQKDNFSWWVKRLTNMKEYFDAYRIDHVLGFFRIWQVPLSGVTGLMGHFNPAIPLDISEFHNRGVHFDYNRMCKPYIREHFLYDRFQGDTDYAKQNFLDFKGHGVWELKEFVDTQRKAADYLKTTEDMSMADRSRNEKLMRALWSFHSEVLLFEVEGSNGTKFHPRICMNKNCKSFDELDDHTKSNLYDLYIDYFFNRQEAFWKEKALIKLPAIRNATNMLICAEDLGMVPACVPSVMSELSMVRLAIQRMPPEEDKDFWHPDDIPYMCVASPSCHDMSTVRGWWEEDRDTTQKFWENILGHRNTGAPQYCEPFVVYEVINQHLYSPCMLAVFPIQDFMGMDEKLRRNPPQSEQINVPANPTHYWRYRLHVNLEDLIKEKKFNALINMMLNDSGRLRSY